MPFPDWLASHGMHPINANAGNYLFTEDIAQIQPMTSTQIDVLNLLGTPTAKAVFDEKTWYYVGLKTEKKVFGRKSHGPSNIKSFLTSRIL